MRITRQGVDGGKLLNEVGTTRAGVCSKTRKRIHHQHAQWSERAARLPAESGKPQTDAVTSTHKALARVLRDRSNHAHNLASQLHALQAGVTDANGHFHALKLVGRTQVGLKGLNHSHRFIWHDMQHQHARKSKKEVRSRVCVGMMP